MTPQVKSTEIHQTLHGYRNGHQLLAASLDLPPATRRLMLSFSDLSGSSSGVKFESYLTGYPIAELGMYAFARTWYAEEMRRPGCVWTQTLLIAFDALQYIQEFEGLTRLFVRPNDILSSRSTIYTEAALHKLTNVGNGIQTVSSAFVQEILQLLYIAPEAPIIVPAPNFEDDERLILALISQQWPRLQRNLTFCTGAFSPRSLNGRVFDLQIVPQNAVSKFQRELPDGRFVGSTSLSSQYKETPSLWCNAAFHDLLYPSSSHLRRFLRIFGVDAPPDRCAFISLTDTFLNISDISQDKLDIKTFVEVVAERFPMPREVSTLKETLFGKADEPSSRLISIPVVELLQALASCAGYKAYDVEALQLRQQAVSVVESDLAQTANLIVNMIASPLNILGEQILESIFKALRVNDLLDIASMRPGLLPLFVWHYPELATMSKVWEGTFDQQQQVIDTLVRRTGVDWSKVLPTIIQSHVQGVAQDLISALGYVAYEATFDWVNHLLPTNLDDIHLVTYEWRQALTSQPEHIIHWLARISTLQVHTLAFVISLLNPHSKIIKSIADDSLVAFMEQALSSLDEKERGDVMAFFLSFALDNTSTISAKLAAMSFETVHTATAKNMLSQQSWRWFHDQVTTFDYWKDWDRCEKLRQTLVNAFIKYDWPLSYFIRALPSEDVFARTVDYCGNFSEGKHFVAKLLNAVDNGGVKASEFVRRVLKDKKHRRWLRF